MQPMQDMSTLKINAAHHSAPLHLPLFSGLSARQQA
jgi:hypothetical protein